MFLLVIMFLNWIDQLGVGLQEEDATIAHFAIIICSKYKIQNKKHLIIFKMTSKV